MENHEMETQECEKLKKAGSHRLNFEQVWDEIGHFGKIQWFYAAVLLFCSFPAGFSALMPVFTHFEEEFSCADTRNSSNIISELGAELNSTIDNCGEIQNNICSIKCSTYQFENKTFQTTVVSEFELVCQNWGVLPKGANTVMKMAFFAGFATGSLLNGFVSDGFGRKTSIYIGSIAGMFLEMANSYSKHWMVYAVLRYLVGTFSMMVYAGGFILLQEYTGSRVRTSLGISQSASFTVACVFLTIVAYFIREWRSLQRIAVLVYIPILVCLYFIDESPRWNLLKGNEKQAKTTLQKIADKNGKNIKVEAPYVEQEPKSYSYIDLLQIDAKISKSVMICLFMWFTNAIVYYGLSTNSAELPGTVFTNMFIMFTIEFPMYVFQPRILESSFGRRKSNSLMFITGGIACLLSTLTMELARTQCITKLSLGNEYLGHPLIIANLTFAFIGKFFIGGSFATTWIWTLELFPTPIRGSALGFAGLGARIGGILTPFLLGLQEIVPWLPGAVFGVMSLLAGVLCLSLPETRGEKMLMTIEDALVLYGSK